MTKCLAQQDVQQQTCYGARVMSARDVIAYKEYGMEEGGRQGVAYEDNCGLYGAFFASAEAQQVGLRTLETAVIEGYPMSRFLQYMDQNKDHVLSLEEVSRGAHVIIREGQ